MPEKEETSRAVKAPETRQDIYKRLLRSITMPNPHQTEKSKSSLKEFITIHMPQPTGKILLVRITANENALFQNNNAFSLAVNRTSKILLDRCGVCIVVLQSSSDVSINDEGLIEIGKTPTAIDASFDATSFSRCSNTLGNFITQITNEFWTKLKFLLI